MSELQGGPASVSVAAHKKRKTIVVVAVLSAVVLAGIVTFFILNRGEKTGGAPVKEPVAELISASGMILVQTPGNPEWKEVKTGAQFFEGALVRTDSSGDAAIKYKNGVMVSIPKNTVIRIRNSGDNEIEITASPDAAMLPLLLEEEDEKGAGKGPFIELQQIIQFGKSLELIGRVETGSSLMVNREIVEVSGEGLFKHFTKPFPASAEVVRLNLRVTDLAGRTRVYTATHDFRPHDEGN